MNIIQITDPNVKRVTFNTGQPNRLAGYEIYGDKKRAAVYFTLDSFIRKSTTLATTLPAASAKLSSFQNLPEPADFDEVLEILDFDRTLICLYCF
jgi:hypothetical protein